MPALPRHPLVLTVAFLATMSGSGACSGLQQAHAAGDTHGDLVSEVAASLAAPNPAYTATYRLAGGDTARVTTGTAPDRTAYEYPGGRLIRTPSAVTRCARDVCTATDPDSAESLPPGAGLITDAQVVALLEAAAIDPDPEVTQRDTTLAGRHATCLTLTGVEGAEANAFDVCVTVGGVLAAFQGTIGGAQVDTVLAEFAEQADAGDFLVPAGAKLIDRRTGQGN
ncbi:hypothetical protein [Actinoplanes sp. DH11]|uniref:hypothetical protein n=1 Tax=Actinoplanes sp. DH11 TaxID=2857011 RepID=UPI001E5F345B|nr:hypothetical protein [Actinoplanes sp. DH11]